MFIALTTFLILVPPMNGWPRSLLGNVLITLQHETWHISPTTYLPQPKKNPPQVGWTIGIWPPLPPKPPHPKAGVPTHPRSPKWSPHHALWDIWANAVGRRSECWKCNESAQNKRQHTKLQKKNGRNPCQTIISCHFHRHSDTANDTSSIHIYK